MAGLIALLSPLYFLGPFVSIVYVEQDSDDLLTHIDRVDQLLADSGGDWYWRNTLYQSITRLEHVHTDAVENAWKALNNPANDVSLSNLLLFQRRNELPLEREDLKIEESNCLLERALSAWGQGDLDTAEIRLRRGVAQYPEDERFLNNLNWLLMRVPDSLASNADVREVCQTILAFKEQKH